MNDSINIFFNTSDNVSVNSQVLAYINQLQLDVNDAIPPDATGVDLNVNEYFHKVQNDLVELTFFLNEYAKASNFFEQAMLEARIKTPAGKLWNITRLLADREHLKTNSSASPIVRWASILRELGYDWAYDYGEKIIHSNEPQQAAFFRGDIFDVAWQGPNPKLQDFPDLDDPDFQARIERNKLASKARKLGSNPSAKLLTNTNAGVDGLVTKFFGRSFSLPKFSALSPSAKSGFWDAFLTSTNIDSNFLKSILSRVALIQHTGMEISILANDLENKHEHTIDCGKFMFKLFKFIDYIRDLDASYLNKLGVSGCVALLKQLISVAEKGGIHFISDNLESISHQLDYADVNFKHITSNLFAGVSIPALQEQGSYSSIIQYMKPEDLPYSHDVCHTLASEWMSVGKINFAQQFLKHLS